MALRYRELAVIVTRNHLYVHRTMELNPQTLLKLLNNCDAFRRPERFVKFLLSCKADARGRTGFENIPYLQADYLQKALALCQEVDVQSIIQDGFAGEKIQLELHRRRISALKTFRRESA